MLYGVIILVIILAALGILFITYFNQFKFSLVKIAEAENNMNLLLEKKLDCLLRIQNIIEKKLQDDEKKEFNVKQIKIKLLDHFKLREKLSDNEKALNKILDHRIKLAEMKNVPNILEELKDTDTDIEAIRKYYNDHAELFNHLVHHFPSNLLAIFLHYHEKELYADEVKDTLEILKD